MVPEKFRLAAIGQFLVAAWERRRPAMEAWTPALEQELLVEGEAELARMEAQCRELGFDDATHFVRADETLRAVILPRYRAVALEDLALKKASYHMWRGGDLIARGAFAGAGLLLGAAAVAIPWIPITEKWVPWALFLGGPFIPDMQMWFYERRHRRKLEKLIADLAAADKGADEYRSLAELHREVAGLAGSAAAPPDMAAADNKKIIDGKSGPDGAGRLKE